jgi:hypothetical protein
MMDEEFTFDVSQEEEEEEGGGERKMLVERVNFQQHFCQC